jgi:hypothetical protein
VDNKQPTTGEWAIMLGGVVALVGSFLDFSGDTTAWGESALPIVTLIPIYAVVMALQVALTRLAGLGLPDRVAGFTWEQVHLVLGVFAALMALFWLAAVEDTGAGMFLMLIGAGACAVGAFMIQRERATGAIG